MIWPSISLFICIVFLLIKDASNSYLSMLKFTFVLYSIVNIVTLLNNVMKLIRMKLEFDMLYKKYTE